MSSSVYLKNVDDIIKSLNGFDKDFNVAKSRALSDTSKATKQFITDTIFNNVDLNKRYISSKIYVRKLDDDVYSISARMRGTMMYRFLKSNIKSGVVVSIRKGTRTVLKGAFPINLRGNKGIALRVKGDVKRLNNSRSALLMKPRKKAKRSVKKSSLFLLYAPSVSQMMNSFLNESSNINKVESMLEEAFLSNLGRVI